MKSRFFFVAPKSIKHQIGGETNRLVFPLSGEDAAGAGGETVICRSSVIVAVPCPVAIAQLDSAKAKSIARISNSELRLHIG